MRSRADVRTKVINNVFADRDRSLEGAVERAIDAGIEFERQRIRSILELSAPPGLEKAMLALALSSDTTIEDAAEFVAKFPLDPTHSAALRKGFRLVRRSDKAEERTYA
jgi:hypothetical protein